MVGQRHFGRREPAHPAEGFKAEDGCEMVLPRPHMQAKVLHWRGGSHRMPPCGAQPLDSSSIGWLAGYPPQAVKNVVGPHLAKSIKQRARVIEHHTRLFALADQLRNELAHALVAPEKHRGVVVIADVLVLHHVL